MADESTFNGVASDVDTRTADIEGDRDGDDSEQSRMVRKVQELEESKVGLERENRAIKESISGLTVEVQQLRSDKAGMEETLSEMRTKIEQSESDRKATDAIAARAAVLESEVCKLQESEEEANGEVLKLRSLLEEKLKDLMKVEKENAALSEKTGKTKDEVESMAAQLRNEIREKARVVEESKAEIGKKESEIAGLKKRAAKLDRMSVLESKLGSLMEELEESKRVIGVLKYKAVNGAAAAKEIFEIDDKETNGFKQQWPAVAAAAGAVAAVAVVIYLRSAMRK